MDGLGGDDEIRGLGATDVLTGGLGSDVIYGGPGNDFLKASTYGVSDPAKSKDVLYGGDDNLVSGKGEDLLYGGDGDRQRDKLYCGKSKDHYGADKIDYVDSSCENKEVGAPADAEPDSLGHW